jgi:hypothetical protein
VDSPNFNTLETGTRLKTWRQERKQGQLVVGDGGTSKPTQTLGCSRSLFKNVPCADPKSTMNNSSGKHDGGQTQRTIKAKPNPYTNSAL